MLPSASEIAAAYAELLSSRPWHWFATLTFRPKHESLSGGMHPEKADKAFRFFVSCLNRECFGKNWHRKPHGGVQWARGQEFHKSGRIHFHAVLAAPECDLNALARRMSWVDWWWKEFGIARIERPESQLEVCSYVSKYVAKDGEVDFSPNFGRYVAPELDFSDAPTPRATSRTGHPMATASLAPGQPQTAAGQAFRCLTLPVRLPEPILNAPTDEERNHESDDQEHPRG